MGMCVTAAQTVEAFVKRMSADPGVAAVNTDSRAQVTRFGEGWVVFENGCVVEERMR